MQTLLRCRVVLALSLLAAVSLAQTAQSPTPAPSFEVASMRPADRNTGLTGCVQFMSYPSNRFSMRCASLNTLIQLAYGTGTTQGISGGPDWVRSQIYSVNAKVEGSTLLTQKQMQPLLQNLLEERFHLKIHRVQHIVPGYALVVANGGPKLQPTKGGPFIGATNGACELKYQNSSLQELGHAIGHQLLKQPVADKTGLDGMYDVDLKFFPDDNPYAENNPACAHLPDVFSAVQQQLGLRLAPQKITVDSIVIDHADPPTQD